ncbi:uncharacterized protein LOC120709303 isoform X5 [Panicum virgatum]|uniref:uncharacterized protein LOC120709303 isoform X5 n=1 Tax=Panicum virgatum TaxID=38727 RepID=UPI0019D66D7C|nr:uncharacterized protein LOC120709303 isoform X5 [Panicum virgatum]
MPTSRKDDDDAPTSWKRNKRAADELPTNSKKSKIISNCGGETTESLISGDLHQGSNQCIWSELSKEVASNLSKSVVSLSLSNGQEFACSGIALERMGNVTRFLTLASLARALIDKRLDHDNLKVEVRLGRDVVIGFLVALGHGFSGDAHVMATNGILTGDSSGDLKMSTCKISKVYEVRKVFHWLPQFTPLRMIKHPNLFKAVRVGRRLRGQVCNSNYNQEVHGVVHDKDQFEDLGSLGYPKPSTSMLNDGMILINTFEEPFGDECGKGVWTELSETASSNIHGNIVALASFNGEIRLSASTGFFIEWNGCSVVLTSASLLRKCGYEKKIDETLRIEVLLPTKQRVEKDITTL